MKKLILFCCLTWGVLHTSLSYARKERMDTINIKKMGAIGDGVSNDYPVLQKVFSVINETKGNCVLYFPKGKYYLGVYNTANVNLDLTLKECHDVKIIGNQATIICKGDFNRSADYKKKYSYSRTYSIIPICLKDCKNVWIDGIEIDGEVDKMSRDKDVVEKGQGLINILGSENVNIRNTKVYKSASDGIYIGTTTKNSRNITLEKITFLNNARQGLSICGLVGGSINECDFNNTGVTGNYGYHRPAAGVDIEPVKILGNEKMGNIVFNKCSFTNNVGGQLLITTPKLTQNITIKNSRFEAGQSTSRYQLILAADKVILDKCKIYTGNGIIWPTWQGMPGCKTTIQNCEITSANAGIRSASKEITDTVRIENNDFHFEYTAKFDSYFLYLQTRNLYFLNNKIFIPQAFSQTKNYTSLIQNAERSSGNIFYSESKKNKPNISYLNTKVVKDQ